MAVVDAGGYAQAAEQLHKSQSAVTYAVQKLESLLAVKAFEVQGRKAVLTPTGQLLYRRASALLVALLSCDITSQMRFADMPGSIASIDRTRHSAMPTPNLSR